MRPSTLLTLCLLGAAAAGAQTPPGDPAAAQIAAAVTPAPEDLRDGASVLGYGADGELVRLRQGEGGLICLADDPSDERFHVACYFEELEPFMARGRELRAAGKDRDEIVAAREAEIGEGKLTMPSQPTALYSLTGPKDAFDPAPARSKAPTASTSSTSPTRRRRRPAFRRRRPAARRG
jgi:hypothetical protein